MPVYDYKCREHGVFYELAVLAESHQPIACPQCQTLSPRIICIAPDILDMAPQARKAHAVNEQSRHEPAVSTKQRREQDDEHKNGCGCQGAKKTSKLMYTAAGDKMFPSMRPWMISH